MLVAQLEEGRAEVENQYVRSVTREGNTAAAQSHVQVFEVGDRKWRGIGRSRVAATAARPSTPSVSTPRSRFGLCRLRDVEAGRVHRARRCCKA
jgi:hydrogenase expression/formation protein HypD